MAVTNCASVQCADAVVAVGRDVGHIERAERRLQAEPAAEPRLVVLARRGVAGRAAAGEEHGLAVVEVGRVRAERARRHRAGNGEHPERGEADDRGGDRQQEQFAQHPWLLVANPMSIADARTAQGRRVRRTRRPRSAGSSACSERSRSSCGRSLWQPPQFLRTVADLGLKRLGIGDLAGRGLGVGAELGHLGVEVGLVFPDRRQRGGVAVLGVAGNRAGILPALSLMVVSAALALSTSNGCLPSSISVMARFAPPTPFIRPCGRRSDLPGRRRRWRRTRRRRRQARYE